MQVTTTSIISAVMAALLASPLSACTTGEGSGKATPDGRPLLWDCSL